MNRVVAIVACGLSLTACSGMPSWMSFDLPRAAPMSTSVQFESEPPGAEARASSGQTCRTPCAMAVAATDFTVTFALPGYQPQTVPVRVVGGNEPPDVAREDYAPPAPRFVPNPVYVELLPAPPPPAARRKPPPPPKKPKPVPRAAPSAQAPAPAPAAAWPPPPAR